MKEKIIIFKNDSVGDLVHSIAAINNINDDHSLWILHLEDGNQAT